MNDLVDTVTKIVHKLQMFRGNKHRKTEKHENFTFAQAIKS